MCKNLEIMKKKYTLEEAYEEILRIKKESGLLEYQDKREQDAFRNGYAKALNDMQADFNKRACLLAAINVF
jgi:hypothetical protein